LIFGRKQDLWGVDGSKLVTEGAGMTTRNSRYRRVLRALEPAIAAYWRTVVQLLAKDATLSAAERSCLVVAPHPDDETFGCGGLIARKVAASTDVHVIVLTDGSLSHPTAGPALAERRRGELARACQILGLTGDQTHFLDIRDRSLHAHSDAATLEVAHLLESLRPDDVVVTSRFDGHPDHVAAAMVARRALERCPGARLLEYPVWSWYRGPFAAMRGQRLTLRVLVTSLGRLIVPPRACRVALGTYREVKTDAIAAYASQVETPVRGGPTMPDGFVHVFTQRNEVYFPQRVARTVRAAHA
jgi:LmbE family N-acetylglucosaminyl deacetylase